MQRRRTGTGRSGGPLAFGLALVVALLIPRGTGLLPGGDIPWWQKLWYLAGGPQLYRAALDSLDGGWALEAALPLNVLPPGSGEELGPEPLGGELPLPPDLAGPADQRRGPALPPPERVRPSRPPAAPGERPVLVAVYHTHTSEMYVGPAGSGREAHHYGTEATDIVAVGQTLVEALAREGIRAVHATAVHDYPSVGRAYQASLATGLDLLARYPSLQVVIDLHRDGVKLGNATALYRGQPAARILLVVTTGGEGLPHPGWEANLAWARRLHTALEQVAPGLSRGVYLQQRWRYNEHIHPRALVVEIGTYTNTVNEARRAARALAKALTVAMEAEGLATSPPELLGR